MAEKFTKKELARLGAEKVDRQGRWADSKRTVRKTEPREINHTFQKAYDWTVQHVSILIMAAGLFGYIYEQSDNNYVVMAVGAGFAYACIHGALGKR